VYGQCVDQTANTSRADVLTPLKTWVQAHYLTSSRGSAVDITSNFPMEANMDQALSKIAPLRSIACMLSYMVYRSTIKILYSRHDKAV
jgi:hypothetical protein